MNWLNIYNELIIKSTNTKRKKLSKEDPNYIYFESHHIIPRCLGGSDDKSNLVLLTGREHYVAHKLLTFIYPNNRKIVNAFHWMTHDKRCDRKISSKDYEYAKILKSLTPISEETRQRMGAWERKKGSESPMYGFKQTNQTKEKLKGPKSKVHKQKMSLAKKGKSYDEIYGNKADKMRQHRVNQTSGKGNPKARKYIIHNKELNQYWYTHGNYNQFCLFYHVSNRTLLLSRKNDKYINNWKCVPYDETNQLHIQVFRENNFKKVL